MSKISMKENDVLNSDPIVKAMKTLLSTLKDESEKIELQTAINNRITEILKSKGE